MCQLVESIKILHGKLYHIDLHNQRCNATRKSIFNIDKQIDLKQHIVIPPTYQKGLVKCRVLYAGAVESVEFQLYNFNSINKVKMIWDDHILYDYKYAERSAINALYNQRSDADEIMIIKQGYVTDASIYNIVFQLGSEYVTPAHPLLKGTQRQHLINKGKIREAQIKASRIFEFSHMHFINAMTPLGKLTVSIHKNTIMQ